MREFDAERLIFIVCMTFFVLTICNLSSKSSNLKISISRKTEKGDQPVEGVRCLLLNGKPPSTMLLKKGETSSNGNLTFYDLESGTYFIQLHSVKFTKKYTNLSLPNLAGPIKINKSNQKKQLYVKAEEAASISGTLEYKGNIELSSAFIFSFSGQQQAVVKKNGEFILGGIDPDRNSEIRISLFSLKASYSPSYKKIIYVESKRLSAGKKTNVGRIEFPFASEHEVINIRFKNKNGKGVQRRIEKNNSSLQIENFDKSIRLRLTPNKIQMRLKDDKIAIRLPSGRYRAWFVGKKDKKTSKFMVSENKKNRLLIDIPTAD